MGHEIEVLTGCSQRLDEGFHFPQVPIAQLPDPEMYDMLLLYKRHGLQLAERFPLLRHPWKKVCAWFDFGNPQGVLEPGEVDRISIFWWATQALLEMAQEKLPAASHTLCEYGTLFPSPPSIPEISEPTGLYAGRLPQVYLDQVLKASEAGPILTYALWIMIGEEQILLRPYQLKTGNLDRARASIPASIHLHSGVNMLNEESARCAAYGLVPTAGLRAGGQLLSACKFYDYIAMGLPIVIEEGIPEAKYVKNGECLGWTYNWSRPETLGDAVRAALATSLGKNFRESRQHIQDWAFENHTYRHRAATMHEALS